MGECHGDFRKGTGAFLLAAGAAGAGCWLAAGWLLVGCWLAAGWLLLVVDGC